jgi:PAS domain S-box-containing protein
LDGVISSWNPGAERLFGFTAHEAIGQSMLMLIPPDRAQEEPQILARIARGENVDHFETVRVRKDGSRIDISATISPIKDDHGRIIGASKIARDITERRQAERKLQAHLERLNLLYQITRAIGERQDLHSILQAVIRSLEDQLPIDFGCGRAPGLRPARGRVPRSPQFQQRRVRVSAAVERARGVGRASGATLRHVAALAART